MALTFPRDLIEPFRVRGCEFDLRHIQARNSARGGLIGVVGLGPSVWTMRYETVPMLEADAAEWEAWLSSLRGGLRLFRAWHPLRRYGRFYPTGYGGLTRYGGGSFDGTCTLSTVTNSTVVTLTGLPVGYTFRAGDMLSWEHSTGKNALHRVMLTTTANGVGLAQPTVEPEIRPAPSGTTVALEKAWCHAVINQGSETVKWSPGQRTATVSFAATQTL